MTTTTSGGVATTATNKIKGTTTDDEMNVGRRPEPMDVYTPEELRDVEQREVVLGGAVVRARRLEASRLVKALHELLGEAALGGDVFARAVGSSGR
jgi:hypothetical protein